MKDQIRCGACGRLLAEVDVSKSDGYMVLVIKCKCRCFNTKSIKIEKNLIQTPDKPL